MPRLNSLVDPDSDSSHASPSDYEWETQSEKAIRYSDYPLSAIKSKNTLNDYIWKQNKNQSDICDVTIKLGRGEKLKAHWCVLVSCRYFRALYESGLEEKKTGILDLSLMPTDMVKAIVQYLYRGKILVKPDKWQDLIPVADYFQMDHVKYTCARYLIADSLNENTCFKLCHLGDTYSVEPLLNQASGYLYEQFDKVINAKGILDISAEALLDLMNNEYLSRHVRAIDFFKLLQRWVKVDAQRNADFRTIFQSLDLGDIPAEMLRDIVVKDEHVIRDLECLQLVDRHLDIRVDKLRRSKPCPVVRSETDVIVFPTHNIMFHDMLAYVIEEDSWSMAMHLPANTLCHVTSRNGNLYACGIDKNELVVYQLTPQSFRTEWKLVYRESYTYTNSQVYACTFLDDGNFAVMTRQEDQICFVILNVLINHTGHDMWACTRIVKRYKLFHTDNATNIVCKLLPLDEKCFVQITKLKPKLDVKKYYYFLYDCKTKQFKCHRLDEHRGEIFYNNGAEVYVETPGVHKSHIFDTSTLTWRVCRRGLPPLPMKSGLVNSVVTYAYCNEELYVLVKYADKPEPNTRQNRMYLYKLSRQDYVWVPLLENLIMTRPSHFRTVVSCSVVRVPKDKVRCLPDCPPCRTAFHANVKEFYSWYKYDWDDDDSLASYPFSSDISDSVQSFSDDN